MKTVQVSFFSDKRNKYLKTFTIYKYIFNRPYCLDKNIENEIIVETCFSKFNLLSISIPKSVTESTDEIIIKSTLNHICFLFLSQLIIIASNLSGFTIISFILNRSMADLLSFSNTFLKSFILFLAGYIVLPSAKLASETSLIKKRKSIMRILNKMGPNIEPYKSMIKV